MVLLFTDQQTYTGKMNDAFFGNDGYFIGDQKNNLDISDDELAQIKSCLLYTSYNFSIDRAKLLIGGHYEKRSTYDNSI